MVLQIIIIIKTFSDFKTYLINYKLSKKKFLKEQQKIFYEDWLIEYITVNIEKNFKLKIQHKKMY